MAESTRVIVYNDEGVFVAQCLEVDIAAQGSTAEEAMKRLEIAFRAELRDAHDEGRSIMDIGPAPDSFHVMFNTDVVTKTALVA